jgi:putative phage-type endonuclease
MKLLTCEQGSPEWIAARVGSLGASRLHEALAKTKSGHSASRANLMAELISEKLTGQPAERYVNGAMQHGIDTEPEARSAYSFYRDAEVTQVGLVLHPTIAGTHASPDGIVGMHGCIEIKCPSTSTHIETVLYETIPDKYVIQMLWQMRCADRAWCDFCSYDNRLPENLRLFVKRIDRDDKRIAEIEGEVIKFLAELDSKLSQLRSKAA